MGGINTKSRVGRRADLNENNRILIVEDEVSIAKLLQYQLESEGFVARMAHDAKSAMEEMERFKPSLVLLDLMLPDMSGIDLCCVLTKEYNLPIIIITARTDIDDKVAGLESGADDYITKPFDFREVSARINSTLRRMYPENDDAQRQTLCYLDIKVDKRGRIVTKGGVEVALTPKEYELLCLFMENVGRVFTRAYILDVVWGYTFAGDTRTVDVHIRKLRQKLELDAESLKTVFGVGYRLSRRS
jgi:two-component system alkaline phosphatase synthesis response regulator PhoP